MWPNPQFPPDLVTFTEKILNGKLHFLYNVDETLSPNMLSILKIAQLTPKDGKPEGLDIIHVTWSGKH